MTLAIVKGAFLWCLGLAEYKQPDLQPSIRSDSAGSSEFSNALSASAQYAPFLPSMAQYHEKHEIAEGLTVARLGLQRPQPPVQPPKPEARLLYSHHVLSILGRSGHFNSHGHSTPIAKSHEVSGVVLQRLREHRLVASAQC